MIKFYLRLVLLLIISTQPAWSQSVLDPNDPVVTYNSASPPTQPAWGAIGKWVRTKRLSWNTDSYKCYIYKGMQFRLKFPKNFNPADTTKKYPMIIFFHGIGEKGSLYDNEYQLYHGGQTHMNKVDNGSFDGFLLYPQNISGYWGNAQYDYINELINNFFVQQIHVDRWRIMIEGLSGGGMATWDFLFRYPKLVAAATPISAATESYLNYVNTWKYMPLWEFQGGIDPNPNPAAARAIEAGANAAGANYKLTIYANMGHSVWNTAWAESDYFPFMSRAYKSNPWPLFGKYEFCPGETVKTTLGLTPGFTAYEWSKDGATIPGATSNTLQVTQFGTYAARVRDGNTWSDWSHTPVVVKIKTPTVTPAIQMPGLQSNVLPTPEGKDSVTLQLPDGYASYVWMKSGGTDTLGRDATFTARETGSYIARVTELYGCSSSFSDPFPVIKASGPNGPDAANGLLITPLSKTSLKLNWADKPSPLYNETLFEVYRASAAGGPYTLVGKVGADVLTFTDNGLLPNTRYYYVIRAVNNNAAAPLSAEASGVTMVDQTPPTAPGNVAVTGSTTSSISISWTAATDDVGVDKYDIYINGKKTYTVDASTTSFIAYGLKERQLYTIVVRARDVTGNQSPSSNQVSAAAIRSGLNYKYYTSTSAWSKLPNFSTLTPVKTGTVAFVDVSPKTATTNYGFVWEGLINIPVTGSYTFETYSDDGSRMYIDQASYNYSATPLVDNDGGHAAQYKQGTVTLSKGPHAIVVTYFQGGGSAAMKLYWKNTAGGVGSTRQEIPAAFFTDTITLGSAPTAPSNQSVTVVSYNKLKVNWKDNSSNETGFEVYRSTSSNGTYNIITTTGPNATSYTDTLLNASTTYYYKVKAINVAGSSALTAAASGKTSALPTKPTAPSTLVATATASDKINLTWKDNSTNETGFEVYRSANNNANYVLIATVGANSTTQATFADSALFANAKYYYQVRARNDGGFSAYSNEAFTTTLNNLPEIAGLSDRTMRYGTQISYNISASDPDDEPVSLTTANTPAFTSVSANGESGITMTFSPASPADIGVYNIQVTATDQHGGVTNRTFKLTVDDNYQPSLTTINDVSLAEKTTTQFTLQASDQNSTDTTIWTVTGLPAFAILTTSGRTAQVALAPGYADAGAYPVTVNISDNKGGTDTKSFTINVTDINPNYSVDINFTEGSYQAAAPWYNTNKRPVLNDVFTNIKDLSGNNTGMAFTILTPWQNINGGVNTNNQGYTTGSNSGIYPDNAMTSNWWTQNAKQTMRFTGLKPGFRYSFTMFGSRYGISDTRAATYTINGASVTLNGTNNTNQTVTINNVRADSAGGVTFDIQPAAGSQYAYINTLVIDAVYDDSTAPAKPGHFAARTLTQGVRLSWTDQAYNENAYELYRASSKAGPYTLLATRPANDTAYTDLGATSGNTWYYLARAINDYGASPFTDTTSILVPNQPPVLAAIANVIMKSDTTRQIAVSATDAPDDVITLSASGFPAFATLTNTGNGTANLNLAPATSDIGKYTLKVIATDSRGDTSSRTFTVQVTDKKVTSIYVNCNQVEPASAPWNNFNAVPNANAGISNLQDEAGNASGISITVLDAMTGANNVGAVTGDNSGVYPDAVMKTFFYDQSGAEKRVRLSGLSASRKYNLVFFGSRTGVTDNRNTIYAANGQSVTLNAASNVSNTVQLNGLTPDGSGNIIFTVKQASGSFSAYLNALVIQSYVDDGKPLSPANLVAAPGTRTSITLNWADKSNNETGFEVYRSASRNGTYTLLGTVATNVTTYTDSNLTANSVYYYKVRAKAGTLYSDYSNIATGGTLAYGLYVNFTTTTIAPAPWNNTAALPYEGLTLGNLQDDGGNTTSVSMTIVSNFTGTNPAGVQTGDNSGVYPDKVMAESYYTETDTARMKISGLDQAKQYSFTFFGSRASGGTRVTAYAIGTKVVTLDANDNRSNTVTIENVKPDGNGEIIITVYTALNYGYLNAMVINAFPPEDSSGLQSLPNYGGGVMSNVRTTGIGVMGALAPTVQPAAVQHHNDDGVDGITVENAYPNPFSSYINLSIRQQQEARILIRLLDGNGRLILVKDLGRRGSGVYQERIDVGNRVLGNGLYLLQILSESKPVKTIKLIRH